ncbi:outer membrane lipoprotein chaperone LolA [Alcanivorax limicola]|uniref:outer membrane lipoprotein chaperone LolA n=1 Tax=Alcanivorax limicola TaxID=2874102 RepID=UPI001CBBC5F2|nr:outer membrane lipoprotein chaperone LolA [Alcanivorax limicola]
MSNTRMHSSARASRYLKGMLAAAALTLLAPFAQADATAELVKRLTGVQSMSCDFEQLVLDRGGSRLQQASGEMLVARPRQFYWHADQPYEQVVVSDGDVVWIYDVDLEQVIERALGEEVGNTPALLFSGNPDEVAAEFHIEESDRHRGTVTYRLRPRGEGQLFEVLEVTFAGNQPQGMRLEDALGQQTTIEFSNVRMNQSIDPARFRFEIPDGADVISEL